MIWCMGLMMLNQIKIPAKDSQKLKLSPATVQEYWANTTASGWLDADHPGKWGANVVGLYGDDAKYNKSGEKFISISWNCVLEESKRHFNLISSSLFTQHFLFLRYLYELQNKIILHPPPRTGLGSISYLGSSLCATSAWLHTDQGVPSNCLEPSSYSNLLGSDLKFSPKIFG